MSIPIEKLSLLGSLDPLRAKIDSNRTSKESGFADKLDKALGSTAPPTSSATDKAREMAQSLTLQMLQSSLSLAGDTPAENATPSSSRILSSAEAILKSYNANLAEDVKQTPSPSTSHPSQLQELTNPVAVERLAELRAPKSNSDTTWLDPLISKASQKYGVDVGLIRAVIKAESNFNPDAVSHAGARGLMQLMPGTARSLGVTDSFDPEQNVMAGTRFLRDLLKRYDGDVDSALAAYNWGPGNVDKHSDHLPRETRAYLARVKQLYVSYNG